MSHLKRLYRPKGMKNYFADWETLFAQYRPLLLSFTFRLTGSLSEAEDIVQETFIAASKLSPSEIRNHRAWLTKLCANVGLDYLKMAYKKREIYSGTWLPDEVPDSLQLWQSLIESPSPEQKVILEESLTTSFLLLIEKLTPLERVIYLLKEIFNYSFKEISQFLGKNEATLRKSAQRARQAIQSDEVKFSPTCSDYKKALGEFFELAKAGDASGITNMLAEDSQLWGDGGGKVRAAGFIKDRQDIATFFNRLVTSEVFRSKKYKIEFHLVNYRPGVVISKQLEDHIWIFDTLLSFEFFDDKIARIYAQRNPDKLTALLAFS